MNLIRLYYNNMDIQPKVLLHQFLRYIGFYVEEIVEDTCASMEAAVAEFYIISNAYVAEKDRTLDIAHEEKTILVCRDGWAVNNGEVVALDYDRYSSEQLFLDDVIDDMALIIGRQEPMGSILAESANAWKIAAKNVAKFYLENHILQSVLYTRCFFKQPKLYEMASENYNKFVQALKKSIAEEKSTDLELYALTYAMYDMNLICERNLEKYVFSPDEIMEKCEMLLRRNSRNEQLLILHADIQFELMSRWSRACDEYLNPRLQHCAYSYYRFGRIARIYLKEYEKGEAACQRAIERKRDYFSAWYQVGLCKEGMGQYEEAIEAYGKVAAILKPKYAKHLLSPIELEYLYKAFLKIELIYRNCLGDGITARVYHDLSERVKQETASTVYLEMVWAGALQDPELKEAIVEAIEKRLDNQIQKM